MPCRPDGNFPEILPKLVRMTAPQDGHEHSTRLYKIKYLGAKCQVLQSAPQRTAAPRRCVQPHPPPPRASKFLQTAMLRRTRQPANDPAKLSPQKNAGHVTQANSFPCSSQLHLASEPGLVEGRCMSGLRKLLPIVAGPPQVAFGSFADHLTEQPAWQATLNNGMATINTNSIGELASVTPVCVMTRRTPRRGQTPRRDSSATDSDPTHSSIYAPST